MTKDIQVEVSQGLKYTSEVSQGLKYTLPPPKKKKTTNTRTHKLMNQPTRKGEKNYYG